MSVLDARQVRVDMDKINRDMKGNASETAFYFATMCAGALMGSEVVARAGSTNLGRMIWHNLSDHATMAEQCKLMRNLFIAVAHRYRDSRMMVCLMQDKYEKSQNVSMETVEELSGWISKNVNMSNFSMSSGGIFT